MLEADYDALQTFAARLDRLESLKPEDVHPIAERIATIVIEDNRKGVLEGVDAEDNPAPPLKYRSEGFTNPSARPRGRRSESFGTTTRRFKGVSDFTFKGALRTNLLTETRRRGRTIQGEILPNNNLSASTYRELDGPRLAPRGEASRVISNFVAEAPDVRPDTVVFGFAWLDVLSVKGESFLPHHFRGDYPDPRYDLRGIRAWGRAEVLRSVDEWVRWLMGE